MDFNYINPNHNNKQSKKQKNTRNIITIPKTKANSN